MNDNKDFIKDGNRFYMTDDSGNMIAEITFPEEKPGEYNIDHTYVCDDLRGQGVADELVKMAVEQIRGQGGKVRATCSYASDWLRKNGGK